VHEEAAAIGIATNNVAEYTAIEKALEFLSKNYRKKTESVTFFMDSQLAAMQLSGVYKIKNEQLRIIIDRIKNLQKSITELVEYQHIPREQNKRADFLLNQALDKHL